MDGMDFEINFTDQTLLEANGEFVEVDRLMKEPVEIIGGIYSPVPSDKWVVKSTVTILHGLGFSQLTCDFYHDGKIVITDFFPSTKDLYCVDIRCLTAWALQFGWKNPEPLPHLIPEWKDFWVLQWETHMIDSDYLDKHIGIRGPNLFENEEEDKQEDDFEDVQEIKKPANLEDDFEKDIRNLNALEDSEDN